MTRPRALYRLILPVWRDGISLLTSPTPYNAQETLVRKARAEAEASLVGLKREASCLTLQPWRLVLDHMR